jgi:8-oxo-dGTP pyrophosphatase MutT (NUDIX family)
LAADAPLDMVPRPLLELGRTAFMRAIARSDSTLPEWNLAELADLINPQQLRPAAVLIGLIERPQGWQVLLTQRTANLSSHAGQVSFPGGKVDATDADVIAAAIREAEEEVGIAPSDIEVLGTLDRFVTISSFSVTPVLALLSPAIAPRAQEAEVAAIFEAPLALFCDPNAARIERRVLRGKLRSTQVFDHQGMAIWGATAAMLRRLVEKF